MQEKIQQIYDLLYSPIVTPYNLLENAKLKNYEYVKYYKTKDAFVAEMKCDNLSGESTIYYYHFDDNNYLKCIYQQKGIHTTLMFDRAQEAENKKAEFLMSKKGNTKKIV
ncbi:MAG: hypothetical protein H6Q67_1977 [Firmicutes bacterium]|nr:hypothetical protein [Bacillota bacterium]